MSLKTWNNGERAEITKAIIESNFKLLGRHLSHNVLAVTTAERNVLNSDYLSDGLIVFDTTMKKWFQYKNKKWVDFHFELIFSEEDWIGNEIHILFSEHCISNPIVQLFIIYEGKYIPVVGGVSIDNDYNVILNTDMPFAGKVVIK